MSTRRARATGDEGVALLLVLAFVLVMAVIVGALLHQSYATLRAARVTADVENRVYAANGGVDWAIQQIGQGVLGADGAPACADPSQGTQTLASGLALNSRTITVTCTVDSGSSVGAGGWSVFITKPGAGVVAKPSAVNDKAVAGPVYNAGSFAFDGTTSLRVQDGDVRTRSACPAELTVAVTPPYGCRGGVTTTMLTPLSPVNLTPFRDSIGFGPARVPDGDNTSPACRVFEPGRYDQPLALLSRADGENYLRSGIYYLDDLGAMTVDNAIVVGGIPGEREQAELAAGCATQTDSDTGYHYGVVIVLGGSSTLELRYGSSVELFGYQDPGAGGASAISLYQIVNEWGPTETSHPAGGTLASTSAGSRTDVVLHGLVYAPEARVSFLGTNQSTASLTGGVVAAGLDLQSAPGSGGLSVSNRVGPGNRTIRIEAATNRVGSEKDLRAIADVLVTNDAARTLTVTSWRVNQ